jgi:hypothetical protein
VERPVRLADVLQHRDTTWQLEAERRLRGRQRPGIAMCSVSKILDTW